MKRYVLAYLGVTVTLVVIDMIWLSVIAIDFYREQIGHLMAPEVNVGAAVGFYVAYVVGVVIFAVAPALRAGSLGKAALLGALFGFFTYGTYDMTNLATLRDWPVAMVVADIAWGTFLIGLSSAVGYLAARLVR